MRSGSAMRIGLGLLVAALCSTIAPSRPAAAQEPASVAGTWRVTWAQAVRRNEDGSVEVQRWGEADLVLEQVGQDVRGTWRPRVGAVTWQVRGTFENGRLGLRATDHDSDDPELALVESTNWQATLHEDLLEGELWMIIPTLGRAPVRRPWRAERS